jgi:hypothetical protein
VTYKISDLPHNATPPTTAKIEIENPTGPTSQYSTIAELMHFATNVQTVANKSVSITAVFPAEVAMGFGVLYTPSKFTTVLLLCSGVMFQSIGSNNDFSLRLHYGTGTPPTNGQTGSPVTGTLFGNVAGIFNTSDNEQSNFFFAALISGLTVGTQNWYDLIALSPQAATLPFTAGVNNPIFQFIELP